MERKDDNYYVKIHPDFLFNTKFKSEKTKCVFIYIKLEHNYQLQHNQTFRINATEMAKFFKVEVTTIYRNIKELVERGFLERKGKDNYKLNNERSVNYKKNQFIMINKNFFIDLFQGLRLLGKEASRAVQLYYYLTYKNGQYSLGYSKMESAESQNKICKALKLHNETAKRLTRALTDIKLICKEEGKTFTLNEFKTELNVECRRPYSGIIEKVGQPEHIFEKFEDFDAEVKKTVEKELGWYKSNDGTIETQFRYDPKWRQVIGGKCRKSDGIPATPEEIETREYVRKFGKVA